MKSFPMVAMWLGGVLMGIVIGTRSTVKAKPCVMPAPIEAGFMVMDAREMPQSDVLDFRDSAQALARQYNERYFHNEHPDARTIDVVVFRKVDVCR